MTFTEFFKKLEVTDMDEDLSTIFDTWAMFLDLPKSTFDNVKEDFAATMVQQLSPENFNKTLTTPEGIEIDIDEMREAWQVLFDLIYAGFDEYGDDLDKDKMEYFENLLANIAEQVNKIPRRRKVTVGIELINKDAVKPSYAHPADAGADVYAIADETILPGETKLLPTGFKVKVPDGYELQARPRSGMSLKTKIRLSNAPGTIDCNYSGEVGVILDNIGNSPYNIKKGDRICQLLIKPCPMIVWEETVVEDNRTGGFGSTGR